MLGMQNGRPRNLRTFVRKIGGHYGRPNTAGSNPLLFEFRRVEFVTSQ